MDGQLMELELKKIRPNRLNPRLEINIIRLNDLADSIRQVGLLEPLIVRPADDGYEVVVGERRYRAAQQVGLKTVPVVVRKYSDEEVIELNLVENIQRQDLSAVEKGNCCKLLLEKYPKRFSNAQALAQRLGLSSSTVKTWLQLTGAPKEIQSMVAPAQVERKGTPEGKIDYTTARTIIRQIPETERQIELGERLASEGLSQKLARKVIEEAAKAPERKVEDILAEVKAEPSELFFEHADLEPVVKGGKTQITSRSAPDPRIKAGTMVQASIYVPRFADLQIVSVERKRLKFFDAEDARREGYSSVSEFKRAWKNKYGEWDDNELVHIISFRKAK